MPEDGRVKLRVYNMLGEEVAMLLNEDRKAGIYHQVVLDGSRLASGVYFSRVEFKDKQLVKKMVMVK